MKRGKIRQTKNDSDAWRVPMMEVIGSWSIKAGSLRAVRGDWRSPFKRMALGNAPMDSPGF